jgi:hypothetical protein
MKKLFPLSTLLAAVLPMLITCVSRGAQDTEPALATNAAPAASAPTTMAIAHSPLPVYHPPGISEGVLPIRVGGGSRGGGNDAITLEVLVPDAVALTTRTQPSLYWYQSASAKTRCEVTLTQPKKAKPLLVLKSTGDTEAGIHSISLSKFNVKLEPKVVYKWSVAVVNDPSNRSQDTIANGVIECIPATPELAAKLSAAGADDKASIYASAGIWYDALDALSLTIAAHPHDQELQDQRAKLLSQVGLDGAKIEQTTFQK